MKKTFILFLLISFGLTVLSQDDVFQRLSFLIGEWEGSGTGFGNNSSKIQASYQVDMDGIYISTWHESRFVPTEQNPDGEIHIDKGFISYDKSARIFIYRQFNIEGFVNEYVMIDSLSNEHKLVFETREIENFVPGGKARWTVINKDKDTIETVFDVSFPGKEYACFGTNVLVRKQSDRIQNEIALLVEENEIPGLNFSIIYPGGKQANYSAGYADKEQKISMAPQYLMFSGSIGKTYAAAVIFQMIEEGKLKLSDKFINYFPDTKWLKEIPNIDVITIEMLLTHTSGLPRYVMADGFWNYVMSNPDKIWSYRDRLNYISGKPAIHPAGKGWGYSDTNYIMLGMLLELLSSNYLYDEISERLLAPYGLNGTFPSLSRDIKDLSMGYSYLNDWGMPEKVVRDGLYVFNPQLEWTGGGFYCSTSDLARWAKLYYDGGVISDTLLKKITTPCPYGENLGGNTSYGMGSFIYYTEFGEAWGHTGTMPGYNSIFAYFPDHDIAVALQVNCDYAGNKMSLNEYLESILEILFK